MKSAKKLHIKSGDTVKVIAGNSSGKSGKVLLVDPQKYRAIVEGLNMITKHVKPSASNPQGGIEKDRSIYTLKQLDACRSSYRRNNPDWQEKGRERKIAKIFKENR